jgi:hypothetical protein
MGLLIATTTPLAEVGSATTGRFVTRIDNDGLLPATTAVACNPAGSGITAWSITAMGSAGVTGLPAGAQTAAINAPTVTIPAGGFVILDGTVTFPALTGTFKSYSVGVKMTPVGVTKAYESYVTFLQGDPNGPRVKRRIGLIANPMEIERRFFEGSWDSIQGQQALDLLENLDLDLAWMILKLSTL